MLTLIGERINMTRTQMREKIWERDEEYVRNEVALQEKGGATHIDINAGGDPSREVDDMTWLTERVSHHTELPLCFDSANADALRTGLEICNRPGTIINSITAEKKRIENTLPLVIEYNTHVIALAMDDTGMPTDAGARISVAESLIALLEENGIAHDRVHIDTLLQPIASNPEQFEHTRAAIAHIADHYPKVHTVVGLSNISFGVPERIHMNRACAVMLIQAGLDGAIIDTTSDGMVGVMYAANALIGNDEFCMNYITAARDDKL